DASTMSQNVHVLHHPEFSTKLTEIKRLAGVAVGLLPPKSKPLDFHRDDLNMIVNLLARMQELVTDSIGIAKNLDPEASDGPLTNLDRDVMSALINLGMKADASELAVRRARTGVQQDFNTVFRRAVELVSAR